MRPTLFQIMRNNREKAKHAKFVAVEQECRKRYEESEAEARISLRCMIPTNGKEKA